MSHCQSLSSSIVEVLTEMQCKTLSFRVYGSKWLCIHAALCVFVSLVCYCSWLIWSLHRILIMKEMCVCVCLCGLEWQKGWRWGLHSKKGFLSRWQRQDWQDAILLGNGVSQPVSLPVRQPLTPLNLAFCWVVTGLALTLHVAGLINCTMKHTQGGNSPRWTLRAIILRLEVPLMALMTKTALSPLPFTPLSLCHLTNTPPPCSGLYYVDSISWMVEHSLRYKN